MKRIIGLAGSRGGARLGRANSQPIGGTSGDDVLAGHNTSTSSPRDKETRRAVRLVVRPAQRRTRQRPARRWPWFGRAEDPIYVDYKQHYITDADRYFGGRGHDAIFAGVNDVVHAGTGNDVIITAGGRNLATFAPRL